MNLTGAASLLVAWTCALALATSSAASQPESTAAITTPVHVRPPNSLDGFAITDTQAFDDSRLGTSYRYKKSGEPVFDVYIYPYETADLAHSTDGRTQAAQAEANNFLASLPILIQRGYFESYRVAFSNPDTTHIGSRKLIGSVVALAVKRHGQVSLSFFYAYGLPEDMLKVRVEVSIPQFKTSNVPGFVHDLVSRLATE
jgi:hypothetical protein